MEVDAVPPPENDSLSTVDRSKTVPFLIRAFVKIGGFHSLNLFEDGTPPITDEHQLYTWKDATLRELITTLRSVAPSTIEFRHPLARYAFRVLYADATNRGAFTSKELGIVYSRDILGDPGSFIAAVDAVEKNIAENITPDASGLIEPTPEELEKLKAERTLDELRFVPGDYMLISVILPKNATAGLAAGPLSIKGSAGLNGSTDRAPSGKWNAPLSAGPDGRRGDSGWGGPQGSGSLGGGPGAGRGSAHWRARPGVSGPGLGRGGPPGGDRDRDRDGPRDGFRDRERERGPRERDADRDRERPYNGRGGGGGRGGGDFGRGGGTAMRGNGLERGKGSEMLDDR
ncbi:hypothetical protein SISNIDRAFT_551127 [Sistotremastrum niveocremeum HHB9708]|uniref:SAP18-domain-containing protein n=1 Tax=Sistotremastrum niveocremeum HHB9708 TaxID=1314777 RepID=A0A164SCF4_9AGAM|nr:hypothetical protein SISNIDRAFT_551127 [Sistotremastrum niveocremeum HHB9708]